MSIMGLDGDEDSESGNSEDNEDEIEVNGVVNIVGGRRFSPCTSC